MVCLKCQSHRMHRIKREGVLRVWVAPVFGYFPWRCSVCRSEQLLKARNSKNHPLDSDSGIQREEPARPSDGQRQRGVVR